MESFHILLFGFEVPSPHMKTKALETPYTQQWYHRTCKESLQVTLENLSAVYYKGKSH